MSRIEVKQTALDAVIGYFSPVAAQRRLVARYQMQVLTGGYKAGRRHRRQTKEWTPGGGSADSDVLPDLEFIRARSRDLGRNSPLAAGTINTNVTNVIGAGLRVQSTIDHEFLGLDEEEAGAWERAAQREFDTWAASTDADITRVQTFYEMQETALRGVLESGDIFAYQRFKQHPMAPFGLACQLIEADRCQQPRFISDGARRTDKGENGNRISGGIEIDDDGAPVAGWLLKTHPGDLTSAAGEWQRYPFYGRSGRRVMHHIYTRLRPGQSRGVPYLAPVVETLKQLDRYTDAEIDAAVVSSFFTVFTKTERGTGLDPVGDGASQETGAKASDKDIKLASGMVIDLHPGEDIEVANPGRPNTAFDPFVMAVLRQIGVALELPFEILIKHFQASYSASRAAIIEAWKYFRKRRAWFAQRFCQPFYEALLYEAVVRGRLDAPGFLEDPRIRRAYCLSRWNGPGQPSLNPLQENKAEEIAQDRGWKTAGQITSEMTGGDWDRNVATRRNEINMAADAGMTSSGATDVGVPDTAAPAGSDKED